MPDPDRLLVITHPVLSPIHPDEIERTLPEEQRRAGWDHLEIAPLRAELHRLHEVDWPSACDAQQRVILERLAAEMKGRRRVAYFGYAPIPLALHLGYRLERRTPIDIYQRHDVRGDWSSLSFDTPTRASLIRPLNLPDRGSSDAGPVVIRVSGSFRIDPAETAEVVPNSLADVDVAMLDPGKDTLEKKGALTELTRAFEKALSRLKSLFPNMTAVHLFVAAPVGLTLRLGTQITPSVYPEIVTYQYWAKGRPRYRRAIVLTADGEAPPPEIPAPAEEPFEWAGYELITGAQETFLEMAFLHDGLRLAAGVVRLGTLTREDKAFCGTGFLIAPDTVLSNYHVLYDAPRGVPVKQVNVWFNYELDSAGKPCEVDPYDGDVSTITGEEEHDWAVIKLTRPLRRDYPVFRLRPSKPVSTGDFVFIIQHPQGRPKKIGLLHNQVVSVTRDKVQYLTDTLPGSSGAPVCNEHWQVVALHHRGLDADPLKGIHCKNQGIHIERVVEGLTARGILEPP